MLANPMDPNLQLRNEVIAIEAAMGRMQEQLNAMRELAAASAAAAASATVTAHRSPLPHNFKAPNLESYSGHKGEDLRAWLFQANEQLDLLGVTDDEARIKIAGMALSKNAKTWYLSVRGPTCSDANRVTTWDQFQTALMAHFYPIDPIKQARDRIANLRQVGNVRDYTAMFRQLCTIITNMSDAERLDRYVRGLKARTRQEVELREPNTFEEASRIAERIDVNLERVFGTSNSGTSNFRARSYYPKPSSSQKDDPMDLSVLQRQFKGPLSKEEKERRRTHNLCMYCGSNKHSVDFCPECPKQSRFQRRNHDSLRGPQPGKESTRRTGGA
jgi:hypothetical protein